MVRDPALQCLKVLSHGCSQEKDLEVEEP